MVTRSAESFRVAWVGQNQANEDLEWDGGFLLHVYLFTFVGFLIM